MASINGEMPNILTSNFASPFAATAQGGGWILGLALPTCCGGCRTPAATEAVESSSDPRVASESDLHLVPPFDDEKAFKGGTATQLRSR